MILKQIYLYPDLVEFNIRSKDASIIRDQTRHICNYLERQLLKLKFNSEDFNKICIIGYSTPKSEIYIASTRALAVPISFDIDHCRSLPTDSVANYYIDLLIAGLKKPHHNSTSQLVTYFNGLTTLNPAAFVMNGYLKIRDSARPE